MEKKNYTVAVDLGCSSVVVAVGEKTPEGLLDVACVVTKPVEGVNAGRIENIELVETEKVKEFVGEYKPAHALLKPGEPMAVGAYATPVYYMEAKRQQAQAMMDAKEVIKKVGREFGEMTGRTYGLIETYMMDDAEEAIVIIGSSAGTAKEAIRELRAQGKRAKTSCWYAAQWFEKHPQEQDLLYKD